MLTFYQSYENSEARNVVTQVEWTYIPKWGSDSHKKWRTNNFHSGFWMSKQ